MTLQRRHRRPAADHRRRTGQLCLWLLAAALVLVQGLGAMHRVLHSASLRAAPPIATLDVQPHRVGDLFSGHPAGHDCDAFDQASHGDAAPGLADFDVADPAPTRAAVPFHADWLLAAQARGFLARGPPIAV